MRRSGRITVSSALMLAMTALFASASAQSPSAAMPADDDMTLVVGTRFVTASAGEATAKAQFEGARIPLTAFNETDSCIDQSALEAATEYFDTLGRELAKAGHYYFVPNSEIEKIASACERTHGRPAQAWMQAKTAVIAFGRVVPSSYAAKLEQSIR
jgi:hypothetical protein